MTSKKSKRRSGRVGLVPDIHIPKEDPEAIAWAFNILKKLRIDELILLGDVVTLDSLSRFTKSLQTASSLPEELRRGRSFFRRVDRVFPRIPKKFLLGNHEDRLVKYLLKHAPSLASLSELTLGALFQLPKNWKTVPYGDFIMRQGVLLQHGKKWGRATCRGNLLLGCNSVQGHSHRVNVVKHRQANGKIITAVELGCLCDMDQGYAKLVDWTHACGYIEKGVIHVVTRSYNG